METLNSILSSAVVAAVVSGVFKTIDVIITSRNKALRNKVKNLRKENKNLTTQIEELKQTVSEHEATINDLRVSQEAHNINKQTDTAYSEYTNW